MRNLWKPAGLQTEEDAQKQKFTVLWRDKLFSFAEKDAIMEKLGCKIFTDHHFPWHFVLQGKFTREQLLELAPGASVIPCVGVDDPQLPFKPDV